MRTNVRSTAYGDIQISLGDPMAPTASMRLAVDEARIVADRLGEMLGRSGSENLQTLEERYCAQTVGADGIELTVGGSRTLTTRECAQSLYRSLHSIFNADATPAGPDTPAAGTESLKGEPRRGPLKIGPDGFVIGLDPAASGADHTAIGLRLDRSRDRLQKLLAEIALIQLVGILFADEGELPGA